MRARARTHQDLAPARPKPLRPAGHGRGRLDTSQGRLEPAGRKSRARRRASSAASAAATSSSARVKSPALVGAPRGPCGNHGIERVARAAGDPARGLGPVHRGVADREAVHRQRGDEAQRVIRRACLHSPVERDPEVVGVARDGAGPLDLTAAPQLRTRGLGHHDVVVGMPASHGSGFVARFEALLRVLPDGLEQPVADASVLAVVDDDERLVDELPEQVERRPWRRASSLARTASAAARSQPPANTESPFSASRSWDRAGHRTSRSCCAASGVARGPPGSPGSAA